ncbi:MAG: hypothetical protein KF821_01845 [Anaerolineales bacterium]|nr:hypothetical protein [Anaerolineales bacterium]
MADKTLQQLADDGHKVSVLPQAALLYAEDPTEPNMVNRSKVIEFGDVVKTKYNILFPFGDGYSVVPVGTVGQLPMCIPSASTIIGWTILASGVGSITLDVWRTTYGSYPPNSSNSITGSQKPALSGASKSASVSLSTWTTELNAGDILMASAAAEISNVKLLGLYLHLERK